MTGFYNRDGVCLLRGTDWVSIYNSTFCPHSVFVCFVWIWEQTAIISLYSINWLVFITEMKCVYCAVRTGSLYIILRSAHTVYLCVLCGSQNKQRLFSLCSINWLVSTTEVECVYCAVQTGSLCIIRITLYFQKVKICFIPTPIYVQVSAVVFS